MLLASDFVRVGNTSVVVVEFDTEALLAPVQSVPSVGLIIKDCSWEA